MILFSFLRSCLSTFFYVPFTFLWSALAFIVCFFPQSRQIQNWIMSTWGKVALQVWGVKLVVKGRENVPAGGCLFIFNHTSFFDIFALLAAYNGDFRFGAKIELFYIPVFGAAMKRLGILPIARSRRESVFKVYEEAQARAHRGEKFALAPEGKRASREELLPFKAGPFIFAINAQMPMVPVVIKGAHAVLGKKQLLPNWDKWHREITVEFLPAIATEGYHVEQRNILQEKAFQEMKAHF